MSIFVVFEEEGHLRNMFSRSTLAHKISFCLTVGMRKEGALSSVYLPLPTYDNIVRQWTLKRSARPLPHSQMVLWTCFCACLGLKQEREPQRGPLFPSHVIQLNLTAFGSCISQLSIKGGEM